MGEDLNNLWIVLCLILSNSLFVAVEYALVRSNTLHLNNPKSSGKYGSKFALKLLGQMDFSLSAIQLGSTVSSLVLGWWGVYVFVGMLSPVLHSISSNLSSGAVNVISILLSLFLIVYLHVVSGLAAKSIAVRFPEITLRILSGFIYVFSLICRPVIFVLNRSADFISKFFGASGTGQPDAVRSLSELSLIVTKSTQHGLLDKEEEQMMRGIIGLSDTVAREVMTPRTDLITIPINGSLDEVVSTVLESGLSRFPVKGKSVDDVIGVLLARDLLRYVKEISQKLTSASDFSVKKIMREPYFVPGTKPVDELLSDFKRRKLHMAVVLDEHGGVDGVVTLEDLIEEIVGEIFDESDVTEKAIMIQENGEVILDGGLLVADLNTRFSLEIPEGDYDTIAGFIFTSLGRLPKPGDTVLVNKTELQPLPNPEELTPEQSLEHKELNGSDSEVLEANMPESTPTRALITVEKVQSNRIATVRLKPHVADRELESLARLSASHGGGDLP